MTLADFAFPKVPTPKTWLSKILKSNVSEDPSTNNMANLPMRCSNLNQITFTIFIDHCQVNEV